MGVNHIPRNYKGQRITRDGAEYCKIEIESYDPVKSFHTYNLNPTISNCSRLVKDGLKYYKSKNKKNWKYNVKHKVYKGEYRVEALVFTTKTKNQGFNFNSTQTMEVTSKYDVVSTTSANNYTMAQIIEAASRIKKYYDKNNSLPNYVLINNNKVYRNELNYLLSKCVYQLGKGIKGSIKAPNSITDEPKAKNTLKKGKIYKKDYLSDAYDSYRFIEQNGKIYNYVVTSRGYMTATTQVMSYSYILEYYYRYKRLPNWVLVWNYRGKSLKNTSFTETTSKTSTVVYKPNVKTTSYDEFLSRIDLGVVSVNKEKNMNITLEGTYDSKVITLYFKKIRRYSGDTNNEGQLTILGAGGKVSSKLNEDTLKFTILNKIGSADKGGFKENLHSTGLVFDYRDQVNCYLKDVDGVTKRVFGGYISEPLVSDDLMTIEIDCSGRGIDGSKKSLLKELSIGGALPSTDLSLKTKTFYSALKILSGGVETPYKLNNINNIIESIPDKKGFFLDLTVSKNQKRVKAINASVSSHSKGVIIRNGRAAKKISTKTKNKKAKIVSSVVTNPKAVHGSCYHCNYSPKEKNSFKNYCPVGGHTGTLIWNPKGSAEGEWTCSKCGADYCAKCGSEKLKNKRGTLTKTSDTSDNTTTTEVGIAGEVQSVVLFNGALFNKDSQKRGWNIQNYPVFEMTYGMGREGIAETKKIWIPRQNDARGNLIPGTGKWVKNKARTGFNKDKPAVFHIEIHLTRSALTKMNNETASWKPNSSKKWSVVTFEFTDTDITSASDRGSSISTQGKVTRINPIWAYNKLNIAAININEWLKSLPNKYLRKIVFKYYHNSESVMYDENNKIDCRMIVKDLVFRQGDAYSPELISTNGQKINDTFETIIKTLRLDAYWEYQKERSKDKLMLRKQDFEVSKYELEEGINGNILSIDNISYHVVSSLCNSIIKVYKVPSGFYGYVASKDIDNLIKYGEHQDIEVLNEDTGYHYANKLATHDESHHKSMKYTYTLTANGYRDIKIGEYVPCTLLDEKLNDIQPLLSMEWKYDPKDRPKIKSTYGLGEVSDKIRRQKFFKSMRKGLPEKRTTFSGDTKEVVYDGE